MKLVLIRPSQKRLNEFNYQTDVAENLKDGEYYISIRNYDLVLADWMLPDGSGLEIINQVKANLHALLL